MAAALLATPLAAQDTVAVRLPEVEVRASRDASPLHLVPAGVTVLGPDVLRRGRPAAALEEVLRLVPGLYAVNPGNPAIDERISVRGFGARSAFGVRGVQVILDGIPQTLPDGQGQLTDVDLAEAERIEVLRGGTSTLYGNAGGGVIAIETRRTGAPTHGRTGAPTHGRTYGSVAAGGDGWFKVLADAAVPVGSGTLGLGGGWASSDGWRDQSAAETRRARLGWAGILGSTDLRATLRWTDQPRSENPGGLTAEEVDEDPTQAAPANLAVDARKAVEQWAGALVMTRALGAPTHGRADAPTHGRTDAPTHRVRLAVFGSLRDVENPLAFGTILLDRVNGGFRAEATLPLGGRMAPLLTTGLDAQWAEDDRINLTPDGATVTLDQVDRTRELGPFALLRLAPARAWVVSAGLRYDHVRFAVDDRLTTDGDDSGDRTMARLVPSVGVVWARGDGFEPYAGIRSSFETPTTTELANRPEGGGLNPDLGPQTAVHWELGARGRSPALEWSAALFLADVDDLLVPFEDPAEPGRRFFRNAGQSRHRGAELGVTWRPAPPLTLRGAYTRTDFAYVDYEVDGERFDGNTIPGVPRDFLMAGVELRLDGGLGAALEQAIASRVEADDANTAAADGWASTDLRLWWDGRAGSRGIRPFLSVRNLFDRAYVGSVVVNAAAGRYYEPAQRRWLSAGVSLD